MIITTAINNRRINERLTRAMMFCLLALAAVLCETREAAAQQWTTNGNNINNMNTGNVGIGTTTPTALLDLRVSTGDVVSRFSNAGGQTGALDVRYKYEGSQHRMGLSDANGQWMFYMRYAPSNTNSVGFFPGQVGIGTESPGSRLDISGKLRMFDFTPPGATTSTNAGYLFGSSIPSGLATEIGGELVNFGINTPQFGTFNPARAGGLIRIDTRATERRFAFYSYPAGSTSPGVNRFSVHLDTGNVFMAANGGNVGIGTATPTSKLHVAGDMKVDGNIAAKYQDVAEWVPSTQQLAAGTVVILDTGHNNHVVASSTPYDTRVAGVVSAQPGIALGEAGEGKTLVATTGRVRVRVDATRAPVRVGDLLVTGDTPGVAMLSQPLELGGVAIHRPGTIIGKALEPLEKGTGEILVLLSLQ